MSCVVHNTVSARSNSKHWDLATLSDENRIAGAKTAQNKSTASYCAKLKLNLVVFLKAHWTTKTKFDWIRFCQNSWKEISWGFFCFLFFFLPCFSSLLISSNAKTETNHLNGPFKAWIFARKVFPTLGSPDMNSPTYWTHGGTGTREVSHTFKGVSKSQKSRAYAGKTLKRLLLLPDLYVLGYCWNICRIILLLGRSLSRHRFC